MGLFDTVSVGVGMSAVACCNCGVRFDVPTEWDQKRRSDHDWFFCPNGHKQHYTGKSDAEKLRDELARAKESRDRALSEVNRQRERVEVANRKLAAQKGATTRIKNRIAKGRCPCCTKAFADLREHMKSQHPDWNPDAGVDAIARKSGT